MCGKDPPASVQPYQTNLEGAKVRKIAGIPAIVVALAACETPTASVPPAQLHTRLAIAERIPEGTEVLVTLPGFSTSAIGTTFTVRGTGNSQGAYCVNNQFPNLFPLFLHSITLVNEGPDPEELRLLNYTFSTPMPPGTQFQIVEPYSAPGFVNCAGNLLYRAVVVNGS